MEKKRAIGKRIKELRRHKGFSQEELAEKAKTSFNYLSRMERGTENPTLDMLLKIAEALEVEMWELFDVGHHASTKELKETITRLLKEADEENLRIAVKVFRSVIR